MRATARRCGRRRSARRATDYSTTSGPIVAKGKVIQGLQGCDRYGPIRCYISAYDANTGKQLWKFYTIAQQRRAGRRHLGQAHRRLSRRRRDLDRRQLRSRPESDLLGRRAGKPWMPSSRGKTVFDDALYSASTLALNVDTGKLAWHFQHVPGESLDLDEVFERVLVDIGDQKVVFSIGKAGILWKLDRRTGKFLGHKETVFQNVFDRIDPKTGVADLPRRHHRERRSTSGCRAARAPKAATTGRR